jgi:hypothetical protein
MPDGGRSECCSDVCIDIEATICLVMRVERKESRVMDMSDVELVDREAVQMVLNSCVFFRQGRHCSYFDELGRHNSRGWKDLTLELQLPSRLMRWNPVWVFLVYSLMYLWLWLTAVIKIVSPIRHTWQVSGHLDGSSSAAFDMTSLTRRKLLPINAAVSIFTYLLAVSMSISQRGQGAKSSSSWP